MEERDRPTKESHAPITDLRSAVAPVPADVAAAMVSLATERGGALPMRFVLVALGPLALGYFLSYLFRAVNAVVAPDLVAELGLSPAELGLLTSAYLLAFAAFQLPLGILLDRYGPRRVQTALLTVAAAGALLFALGDSVALLTLGRALIGLGFAGGLMAGFQAIVLWVSEARRALANSCVMAFGGLGLVVSTLPTQLAVQAVGWRGVFLALAATTLAVAALIAAIVPDRRRDAPVQPLAEQARGLGRILASRAFWRLAPLVSLTAGTHVAIQTLWAGPFLRDVAGFSREAAATHLFIVAAAFLAGILTSGVVADRLVRRGVGLLTVMIGFLAAFMLSEAAIILFPTAAMVPVWIVFGMTGQTAILAYPWLSSHFGSAMAGRVNTAANLGIFVTAFAAQSLIGAVIGAFPPDAAGHYPAEAYRLAFGLFLAAQVAALVWFVAARPARPEIDSGGRRQ